MPVGLRLAKLQRNHREMRYNTPQPGHTKGLGRRGGGDEQRQGGW